MDELVTGAIPRTRWERIAPAATLLLLAPMVGEVLSGATRLSYMFVLIPEIMVWGCGALIIRELVTEWRGSWTSVLLLGLALSVAEEFVIQQTSLAPLPWLNQGAAYGRAWGVNWLYFVHMLGYESVWIVLVPVQLTELIFPDRRGPRWTSNRGMIAAGAVFVFGSVIAWYLWTQQARPMVFHVPKYQPPLATILIGLSMIALLTVGAYGLSKMGPVNQLPSRAPAAWLVGLAALFFATPWWILLVLVFVPQPQVPVWIPFLGGCAWGAFVYFVVRRWARSVGWGDMHRWALASGTVVVCMAAGFLGSSLWSRADLIAKAVFNLAAVLLLAWLGMQVRRRTTEFPSH